MAKLKLYLGLSEINDLIRDTVLNDDGKLVVDPSLVSNSGVVFEVHDRLPQTTMFILLNFISRHTLQNKIKF